MAISDFLKKFKGSEARMPSPFGTQIGGRIAYPDKAGYTANVVHGFNRNPVSASCVGIYASTLNEPPLGVANDDGTVNINHPLSILFRRPNKNMGQAEFWQIIWTYLAIGGNAYIKKVRSPMGNIVELIPYSDAFVAPLLDELGWVYAYRYQSGNFVADWTKDDVIHLQNPAYRDPLKMHMGVSPIEIAWDKINTYNELQATMYSLVASNAVPSGILSAPGDIPIVTVESLKQQLKKRRDAKGRDRTDPLVLGSGLSYTQMGLDATKLQANEMLQELEVAICGAFRIHPVVALTSAGLARSTYNNISSAYKEFTTLTRVPFWNSLEEQLEAGLYKEYPAIQLQFDLSYVQALQPDPNEIQNNTIAEWNANMITLNEARSAIQLPDVDGGQKYLFEQTTSSFGPALASAAKPEVKVADAKTIVIVDIDDTLLRDGNKPIEKTIAFVNDLYDTYRIEIVSGRPDSHRASTENELRTAGVKWNGLHLNDTTAPSIRFKEYKAGLLLKEYSVHLAIDNDQSTRDMYSSLGISVKNPATIPDLPENSDAIEAITNSGDTVRIKWVEAEALKYYQKQNDIAEQYAQASLKDIDAFIMGAAKQATTKKGTKASGEWVNVQDLVRKYMVSNKAQQEKLLQQILEQSVQVAGAEMADLASTQSFVDDLRSVQGQALTSKMTESGDTLKREISKIVDDNPRATADELKQLITDKCKTISAGRAGTIARTTARVQATSVQNQSMKRLNERQPKEKRFVNVWLSQRDDVVRPSHEDMDGNWVEVGESFSKYAPGFGTGPGNGSEPEENINCRCTIRPVRRDRITS